MHAYLHFSNPFSTPLPRQSHLHHALFPCMHALTCSPLLSPPPQKNTQSAGTNPRVTITFGRTRFLDIPSIQDADDNSAVKTVESLLALIALQQVDVFQILGRKQFEMNKEANWCYPIACCYLLLLRWWFIQIEILRWWLIQIGIM